MGLRDDHKRFREVGESHRQDLEEFIKYGELGPEIRVPVKIVELPEFEYDRRDQGGVGQAGDGQPRPGEPVAPGEPDEGDGEGDEAGEGSAEHEYYEMDPEEFARELDDRLGLDLEPKGKRVVEEVEDEFTDVARTGPSSALDVDWLFKQGLKRTLATEFDEEYVTEALRVAGWEPAEVFDWARGQHIPVSKAWLQARYDEIGERDRWPSIEAMEREVERTTPPERIRREGIEDVSFRRDDERYRHARTTEKPQRDVVVVNIRDVSGSMRESKRELVERTFTPLDWYLQGKYDRAEFVYIAHDSEAWEVDREEFFGIRSGGGTRISSAYELAAELLEAYPFSKWNRYVFAAGDGENAHRDTERNVVPLMERIDANLHAYVETRPDGGGRSATHARDLEAAFEGDDGGVNLAVTTVAGEDDVVDAITTVLGTETDDE